MPPFVENPLFVSYGLMVAAVAANLLFLWAYSGVARVRSKIAINAEDAKRVGARHEEENPPEVARVLRAHANGMATTVPFLALGLVYVLAGGNTAFGRAIFVLFTVARYAHTFAYLGAKQPWRTIAFVPTMASNGLLILAIAWRLLGSHAS